MSAALISLWVVLASVAGGQEGEAALLKRLDLAQAYSTMVDYRLCADPTLRLRADAAKARLSSARAELTERTGKTVVGRTETAIARRRDDAICSNAAAAGKAVRNFEQAVADLEAALE